MAGDKQPHWRAGGIMLQMTPERQAGARRKTSDHDDWERLSLLLKTVEDLELVDTAAGAGNACCGGCSTKTKCGCSRPRRSPSAATATPDRIAQVLKAYAPEERAGLADPDGIIRARCEFCGTTHEIGRRRWLVMLRHRMKPRSTGFEA